TSSATTAIFTLSLHDALPIWADRARANVRELFRRECGKFVESGDGLHELVDRDAGRAAAAIAIVVARRCNRAAGREDENGGLLRSEEHTSELQSLRHLVCRLL